MRKTLFALVLAAMAIPAVPTAAQAQDRQYHHDMRDARQDYRRDMRDADSRRDVRDARRDYRRDTRDARRDAARRDWRRYRSYDYNRYEPGYSRYYADRYYRDGRYYQPRRLTRYDRIYRGRDGRYYCRRSDGTTGLIAGAALGGILGNSMGYGDSRTISTLLGAGIGAALGSSIDRGRVYCR